MSAVPSAVPSLNAEVNISAGFPTTERWPGAVDPNTYTDPGPDYPIEGPASTDPSPYGSPAPHVGSGGGLIDTSYLWGTDGPSTPWDSSGGQAVTPNLSTPGALNPELHADDGSGAVAAAQTVVPAYIGTLTRHTGEAQTYNREYVFESSNGQWVPSANGRQDYDQAQYWNPSGPADPGGGYDPWQPGYSERPVLLNVAYMATQVNPVDNLYGVNGPLPDRSQWNAYPAENYLSPPDPIVNQTPTPSESNTSGWLIG